MQRPHGLAGAVVEEPFDHVVRAALDDHLVGEAALRRAARGARIVAYWSGALADDGLEADRRTALVAALAPLWTITS